jgi:hypothetical protein
MALCFEKTARGSWVYRSSCAPKHRLGTRERLYDRLQLVPFNFFVDNFPVKKALSVRLKPAPAKLTAYR